MKNTFLKLAFICLLSITVNTAISQSAEHTSGKHDANKKTYTVKTSCGKCKFGMTGKTCELAIKLNGKTYYVEGAAIDDFGDAHANDGFCNSVRQAKVQGEVVNGKFVATYFELLPSKKKK